LDAEDGFCVDGAARSSIGDAEPLHPCWLAVADEADYDSFDLILSHRVMNRTAFPLDERVSIGFVALRRMAAISGNREAPAERSRGAGGSFPHK
jgi:hypothetical protein